MNGTITVGGNTTNSTYMVNHTISVWLDGIVERGNALDFDVNISVVDVKVLPYDSWHYIVILTTRFDVSDKKGMCHYTKLDETIYSITPIIDKEDPTFALRTMGAISRLFAPCNKADD